MIQFLNAHKIKFIGTGLFLSTLLSYSDSFCYSGSVLSNDFQSSKKVTCSKMLRATALVIYILSRVFLSDGRFLNRIRC